MTIEGFAEGPAEADAADALAGAEPAALLALVEELLAAGRVPHLELMGRDSFPKAVRKAAKRAIYKLRSAGVAIERAPEAAAVRLSEAPSLDDVALAGAPGLSGRYWLLLAELPEAAAVAVETAGWDGEATVSRFDHMSVGRLRHYEREMRDEVMPGKPIVASASLAVRMIDRLAIALRARGGGFPTGWPEVLWWRERAVALGARPEAASARVACPPGDGDEAAVELLDVPLSGPHVPDQAVIEALITQVIAVTEGDHELTRDELVDRLEGLADASCDAYFADPARQDQAALALEASADVLVHAARAGLEARGDAAARACLEASDALATAAVLPHEIPLLRGAWRRVISYERAWEAYRDHRGAAGEAPGSGAAAGDAQADA